MLINVLSLINFKRHLRLAPFDNDNQILAVGRRNPPTMKDRKAINANSGSRNSKGIPHPATLASALVRNVSLFYYFWSRNS